jgi:hypothetical protein
MIEIVWAAIMALHAVLAVWVMTALLNAVCRWHTRRNIDRSRKRQ